MKKTVIAIILCAVAIAIGLSLPKIAATSKDDKLNNEVMSLEEIEGTEDSADLNVNTSLSLADKIRIIGSADTSYVGIEYGKYRNEKDVIASVVEFDCVLNGMYINDDDIAEIDNNYTITASVATENYGAGRSFICWNVTVTLDKDIIGFEIDDETGKVLKFTRIFPEQTEIAVDDEVADCVMFVGNQLAEYYGFNLNGLDYPPDERTGAWGIRYTCGDSKLTILLDYNSYGLVINEISQDESNLISDDAEISTN